MTRSSDKNFIGSKEIGIQLVMGVSLKIQQKSKKGSD